MLNQRGGGRTYSAPHPLASWSWWKHNQKKKICHEKVPGWLCLVSLLIEDDQLLEKSLIFSWPWDYDLIEKENENGKSISFKYWEKGGLEVGLTYFKTYLVGKMYTLEFCKRTVASLVLED
jgi:hypothetical protein